MTPKRMFYVMVGAATGLVLLGVVSLVEGDKILSTKATALSNLRLTGQVLNAQQDALVKAKQAVIKDAPLNNIAKTVVPQEKDQALTIRQIVNIASQNNIAISSITFPASNLGLNSSSSTSTAPKVTTSTGVVLAPSQLSPALGLTGIYILPITVQSDVNNPITFAQLTSFLQSLEQDRHTAQVNQLSIIPSGTDGHYLSFKLVINVYIKR